MKFNIHLHTIYSILGVHKAQPKAAQESRCTCYTSGHICNLNDLSTSIPGFKFYLWASWLIKGNNYTKNMAHYIQLEDMNFTWLYRHCTYKTWNVSEILMFCELPMKENTWTILLLNIQHNILKYPISINKSVNMTINLPLLLTVL